MITPTNTTSGILKQHCAQFDITDKRKVQQLSAVLDSCAQHFAQIPSARHVFASLRQEFVVTDWWKRQEAGTDPKLWIGLRQLWRELVHSQLSHSSGNDDDISRGEPHIQNRNEEEYTSALRSFCIALAKFTRNIVAGVPENQLRVLWVTSSMHLIMCAHLIIQ